MFDHVGIRASDRGRSEAFYRCVFEALGFEPTYAGPEYIEWDDFAMGAAESGRAITQHLHVGFVAETPEQVEGFWEAGIGAGYTDDGRPGERPHYDASYYGAFLRDPDGNSIEAVHHDDVRRGGNIDHLWIGVRDLDASVAFYNTIARHTGLRLGSPGDSLCQLRGAWATTAVVADGRPPTSGLHIAFPAPDTRTVCEFHAAALAAGYQDNGGPGERPHYHPGYFGAFVLDPDGNNVESVFHGNR
jgi:catechol 2,3-dioxygenase-like lactoylglutathione lyase family enzyme